MEPVYMNTGYSCVLHDLTLLVSELFMETDLSNPNPTSPQDCIMAGSSACQ